MRKIKGIGRRAAVCAAALTILVPGVLSAQAPPIKPAPKPQVVDMGVYKVSAPSGEKWRIEEDQENGRVIFSRSRGAGLLGALANASQQRETAVAVSSTVQGPWTWPLSADEALNFVIDGYVKAMSAREENSFKLLERGNIELGEKKLHFAKFQGHIEAENDPGYFFTQDQLVYYYFPPDFKQKHRYFQFELVFTRADSGLKLYQNPGSEPVLAVIESLEIADPLKDAPGPEGELIRAAVAGDVDAARRAIEKGAKADAVAPSLTALGAAALYGRREIVEFLLGQGADINKADMEGGRTPLHQALIGGAPEIAGILIQEGAAADPRTLEGYSPLMYATIYDQAGIVTTLIERGADVNARNNDGETALTFAAQCGSIEMTKLLVAKEADVNAQTNSGWTALMHAIDGNHMDIARLLLEGGVDVGLKATNGWTALRGAISAGDLEIVRALIEKGADVNSKMAQYGWTPLLHALSRKEPDEIAMALIEAGADVKSKLDSGTTALMFAAQNASADVVKLILGKGVDVNAKNGQKWTALKFASKKKRADIVQILKAAGAKG